jgi:hypothetical protein
MDIGNPSFGLHLELARCIRKKYAQYIYISYDNNDSRLYIPAVCRNIAPETEGAM